ncbi:MAG: Coenzyme F420 hydrogenase/dehydrogenase, beta subunit C-terminal domain [Clostridia bacterium]|nr:Coenzyme F420 hydrogenase/dehydrogenase, beta subunit C-terminal domain [Clostridia bacterium]
MINVSDKTKCCGCHACASVCPKGCIEMVADGEGFLYPNVDTDACIGCGKCERVCPLTNENKRDEGQAEAYAAVSNDSSIRAESSSGGVFTLVAEAVIDRGGAVFGAAFNEDLELENIAVESKDELSRLRGSKYLQSRIGDSYRLAKDMLEGGRPVLFSGTPCQVAGLKSYLGRDYDALICIDVACHGVPSPKVWEKYLRFREQKADSNVKIVRFRDKSDSWKSYCVRFEFENGSVYRERADKDPYMRAFIGDVCLRPSCHTCKFKAGAVRSDITLADFWGVNRIMPEMDDDKGTSLVIANSQKGRALLQSIGGRMRIAKTDADAAFSYNPAIIRPSAQSPNRDAFLADLDRMSFDLAVKKYCTPPLSVRIKRAIRKALSKAKRVIIKNR